MVDVKGISEKVNGALESAGKVCKPTGSDTSVKVVSRSQTSKMIHSPTDKRVALTAVPRKECFNSDGIYNFAKKIIYVLGNESSKPSWLFDDSKLYGLLRNSLGGSAGLIFPYTPRISQQVNVHYDSTNIIHSNLNYHAYKNTEPPSINIDAKFTADNKENALHMLSAIWFITACSKCDFGENSSSPGLPPPILYLSGYNSTMDDIPTVISNFNYDFPDDAHYVNLIVDLSKRNEYGGSFLPTYEYQTSVEYSTETMNGEIKSFIKDIEGGVKLSFWLPLLLNMRIQLKVQPNLLKTRKQWSLEKYKSGELLSTHGKNPSAKLRQFEAMKAKDGSCLSPTSENTIDFIPSGWTW